METFLTEREVLAIILKEVKGSRNGRITSINRVEEGGYSIKWKKGKYNPFENRPDIGVFNLDWD